ncbi:MarR family winged helix-turn-helix transcriptional regulator [Protaetiibacter intestinalis]|nr:MarR family transcriptional regulator [Protaetiibacter intestinalis]
MPSPPIRLAIGLLLRRSHRRAAEALDEALRPLGLTGRHFGVMMLLDREQVSTQRDLIRATGSDKAGMTRTIADLQKLGHVRRERSTEDRRLEYLSLTDSGRSAFATARALTGAAAARLFDGFSDEELDTLARLLRRFADGS